MKKSRGFVFAAIPFIILGASLAALFAKPGPESDTLNAGIFLLAPTPITGALLGAPIYCRTHPCSPATPEGQE